MPKWSAHKSFDQSIARKAFAFQRDYHALSAQVMESARKIKQYNYSKQDVEKVAQALGVKSSGATRARQDLRDIRSTVSTIGQISVLADVASRGGATGVGAGLQLSQIMAGLVEKLTKNKQFQDGMIKGFFRDESTKAKFIQQAVQRGVIKADQLSDAQKSSALSGLQGIYALRRGARVAAAAVGYVAAGYELTKLGLGFAEGLGGLASMTSERQRMLRSEAAIARADMHISAPERAVAEMKARAGEIRNESGFLPLLGGAIGDWRARRAGVSGLDIANLEARNAARNAGGGVNAVALQTKAYQRLTDDRYGFTGGRAYRAYQGIRASLGLPNSDLAEEVTQKAIASLKRRDELRGKAFEAADKRDFGAASAYFDEARKEAAAKSDDIWANPAELWTALESARGATRRWAASNMPRAYDRTGD